MAEQLAFSDFPDQLPLSFLVAPLSCPCPQVHLWACEGKDLSALAVGSQPWLHPEPEFGDSLWRHNSWLAKETTEPAWGLQDGGRWQARWVLVSLGLATYPSSLSVLSSPP